MTIAAIANQYIGRRTVDPQGSKIGMVGASPWDAADLRCIELRQVVWPKDRTGLHRPDPLRHAHPFRR